MEEKKKYMRFQDDGYILGFFGTDRHGNPLDEYDYVWVSEELVKYVCSINSLTLKRKDGIFDLEKVYSRLDELFDTVIPEPTPIDPTPSLQQRIYALEMALLEVL